MTARADEQRDAVARTRTSVALWFAVLGGPTAGLFNVIVSYPAVDRACVNDSALILHMVSLICLIVAVAAGWTAWVLRQRIGEWPSTAGGALPRAGFMITLAFLTSAAAVFGIVLQWIPIFFLGACHST